MKSALLILLVPELLVLGAAIGSLFVVGRSRVGSRTALLLAAAVVAALIVELVAGAQVGTLVPGVYRQDRFALFAKAALLLATLVAVVMGGRNEPDRSPSPAVATSNSASSPGSRSAPLLACLFGMLAASAPGPIPLLLWTELAVVVVVASGWLEDRRPERHVWMFAAATGTAAAAGIVLLYAVVGSGRLAELTGNAGRAMSVPVVIAVLLVIFALVAQLVAVRWFGPIAAGAAGIAVLKFAASASGAAGAWPVALPVLAALLMLLAALGALSVGPARNLLAWAGLLQIGWLVGGVAAGGRTGFAASLFLLGAFLLASAAGEGIQQDLPHGVAGLLERGRGRGLGYSACLLSLAGLPPLAGFFGVFAVIARLAGSGLFWLVALGLLATSILAFAVQRDLRQAFLATSGDRVGALGGRSSHRDLLQGGGFLAAVLLTAYGLFANPISGLALQGAAAAGLR